MEASRFEGMLDETLNVGRKRAIAYVGNNFCSESSENAILIAVLLYGGHLVIAGESAPISI